MTKKTSDLQLYFRLLRYVKPLIPAFVLSIVGYALYSGAGVRLAALMETIVDMVNAQDPRGQVVIPLTLLTIIICRGIGFVMGNYFLAYVTQNVIHNLRCEVFNHTLSLPVQFFNQQSVGHLIARVTYHVNQVTGAASDALKVVIREGLFVMGLLGYLFYLNWQLSLVFLVIAPLIAWIVALAGETSSS